MTDHGSFDLFKAIADDKRKAVARLPIYTEEASKHTTPPNIIVSYGEVSLIISRKRSMGLKEHRMAQDQISGAAANEWGRVTARAIASKIGAIMKGQTSNEALLEGKTVVIKCAASATDSVGVTFKMLDRLDSIIGAFQLDDASFELWSLSPEKFRNGMRDTRSRGSAAGKVGIVRRQSFEQNGRLLGRIRLDEG